MFDNSIKIKSRSGIPQRQKYSFVEELSSEDRFEDLSSYSMEMRTKNRKNFFRSSLLN